MARIDEDPEDRDKAPLRLTGVFDCPECDVTFDHIFVAGEGVYDTEDLIEAPVGEVECPSCGCTWMGEFGGWVAHGDAG